MAGQRVNQTDQLAFHGLLDRYLESARESGGGVGLLIAAVENYGELLGACGQRACDEVIARVALQLRTCVRVQDRVLRIGESRFAIIVTDLKDAGILVLAASKISRNTSGTVPTALGEFGVGLRIGAARGPAQAGNAEALVRNAQAALLTASIEKEENYAIFSPGQVEQTSDRLKLENELDAAIRDRELEIHYQPKVSAIGFRPTGAEALMRWNSSTRGSVSPEIFLPLADRRGRMEPLTSFLLNAALVHAAEWPAEMSVSINLSPVMLDTTEIVSMIESALKLWDFSPERLFVEITEGALMADPASSFAVLSHLRGLGVKISIDDFGAGYSSFAYFKEIPADELKIDQSFVRNILQDEGDRKIVRTIVRLSKEFGLEVTAEGVEDEATAKLLGDLGCDCLQGFYFSRALPPTEARSWLISAGAIEPDAVPAAR